MTKELKGKNAKKGTPVRSVRGRICAMIAAVSFFTVLAYAQDGTGNGNSCSFATIRGTGHDVNDSGAVVGSFNDASGHMHGYLLRNGSYSSIDDPHAVNITSAEGVNNYGRIVGWYTNSAGQVRAFTLTSSGFRDIFTSSSITESRAFDTNNHGDIVGTYTTPGPKGGQFGFVRHNGLFSKVAYPGATSTIAYGINDLGWIVGVYQSGATTSGFLFRNGVYTTLSLPAAFKVNNQGDIVGNAEVYDHGKITAISHSGYSQLFIFGVNKYDSIVGSAIGADGHTSSGFFAHCSNVF